jgi:hypothetical protein
MQAPASLTLIAGFIAIAALAIALGATIFAPIVAVPFFILGFGAFLLWRGKRRADTVRSDGYRSDLDRVPSTEDTAADPVRDSGVAEATASGTAGRHRADSPGV